MKILDMSIDYYCNNPIKKYQVVGINENDPSSPPEVDLISKTLGIPIGLSMCNVVPIKMNENLDYYNNSYQGSKLSILTCGELIIEIDTDVPIKQPIYVDMKNSSLTWRKVGPEVGYTTSKVNNGLVTVYVRF